MSAQRTHDEAQVDWTNAIAATKRDDYATSVAIMTRLAEEGFADACIALGGFFEKGRTGLSQDLDAAERWYKHGAYTLRDDKCKFELARFLIKINGADDSSDRYRHAISVLKELCRKKHPQSCLFLGSLMLSKKPKDQQPRRADVYVRVAANAGFVAAILLRSHIAMRQGHFCRAIAYRLGAIVKGIAIVSTKDMSDSRLRYLGCDADQPN